MWQIGQWLSITANVLGLSDANSAGFDMDSKNHVIDIMPDQKHVEQLGGTMRLGKYPCQIMPDTKRQKSMAII